MRDGRFFRFAIITVLVLLAASVAQPYVTHLLLSETAPRSVTARGDLSDAERSTIALFEQVSPSVVQVVGRQGGTGAFEEEGGGVQSGTGFAWDGAGNIVTNNHVVNGTTDVVVRLGTGEAVAADIVGTAPNYDLAVIRLRSSQAIPKPVAIGSSADLKVGQFAFAIGNPFGLDQSLTFGVISALHRRLPTSSGHQISNVIQTDAAVNPGNSGGPLLDSSGRVVGVNTAIISPSGTNAGIGFAIPIDIVNRVVPQLIRDGHVPTPGIGIVAVSEQDATRLGVEGIPILRTLPNSPAARAGLHGVDLRAGALGDVIVSVNEKPVRRLSDLTNELDEIGVGHEVKLGIMRNNRNETINVAVTDVGQSRLTP
ncbi:MAG TPA: trypsin-like peptidase domain-containing protein [Xanthobacteraceae bacterium]|nr:trypsin-like peptidase domain-containing protein [Xanthobacteraceae bacterium]